MSVLDSVRQITTDIDQKIGSVNVDDSLVPYFELALGFMVVEYVFHTYLDFRQRQAIATGSPPAELKDHYTDEHVKSTRAYSLDKKNFALVKGLADAIESFSILWFQLLPQAWDWSKQVTSIMRSEWAENEIIVSIVFMLLSMSFDTVKGLPWSLYRTFVIEERHGFNKQTLGLFISDTLKSLVLTFLLTPPIAAAVVYILLIASPYMPLFLWAFIIALQLTVMTVYPVLIAPLFNKYEPLPEGDLRLGIEKLAEALTFPLKKLFVVDGSKRSGHSNAYMYGFGRNKRIVLYDTLLTQCDKNQVVAVLAHELGHWKLNHTLCLMFSQQVIMLMQFVLFTVFRNSDNLMVSFGFMTDRPVIFSLLLFMMINGPVDKLIGWLFNLLSRRFEFQADNFAVGLKHAEPLTQALKILDKENKSDFVVDRLYSQYHYSHPPMAERLRAIRESAKKVV